MNSTRAKYGAMVLGIVSIGAVGGWIIGINAPSSAPDDGRFAEVGSPSDSIGSEVLDVSQDGPDGILIPAVLSGRRTIMLVAKRDGVLASVCCDEGALVQKDQIIADLNDDGSRANLHQAELEVSRLRIEQEQLEALVKLNESDFERQNILSKAGLISRRDLDQAQYKLLSIKQDLKKALLNVQFAQAKVDEATAGMERGNVRTPLTGIIAHCYVKLGASIVRGERLFEVSAAGPLEVSFQIPRTEQLKVGGIVDILLVESTVTVAQAQVRQIDPVSDGSADLLGCLAEVIGASDLIPETVVYVRIRTDLASTAPRIPRVAPARC